jgi:hypothetical protein
MSPFRDRIASSQSDNILSFICLNRPDVTVDLSDNLSEREHGWQVGEIMASHAFEWDQRNATVYLEHLLAAVPLDVRKGSAFPAMSITVWRLAPEILRRSLREAKWRAGKPKAFRTSGGRAVSSSSPRSPSPRSGLLTRALAAQPKPTLAHLKTDPDKTLKGLPVNEFFAG